MMTWTKCGLLAMALSALLTLDAWACGRRGGVCWYQPPYYPPPCWPCHPPDETPLVPPPPHPGPATNGTKLTFQNRSYSQAFAIVWIRHPDGFYRMYEKEYVNAGTSVLTPRQYYQGDHLLIETWTRGTPTDCWHCRCTSLVTLSGLSGTFDVIHCQYTRPHD